MRARGGARHAIEAGLPIVPGASLRRLEPAAISVKWHLREIREGAGGLWWGLEESETKMRAQKEKDPVAADTTGQ